MYPLLEAAPMISPLRLLSLKGSSTSSTSSLSLSSILSNLNFKLMLYKTAQATIIETEVSVELARPLLKQGNFLFHTPKTRSIIFLVLICALL